MRLIVLCLGVFASCLVSAQELPLYQEPVNILSSSNFTENVDCKTNCTAWLVQFYRSTSNTSMEYVGNYTRAVDEAAAWKDIVQFGVVDCNDNEELCKIHGFKYIPLLKYFPRNAEEGNLGNVLPTYVWSIDILTSLADELGKDQSANKYSDWPDFSNEITAENLTEIWNEFEKCVSQVFVIPFMNRNIPAGLTNLIRANNYIKGEFPIARVSEDHPLVTTQGITVKEKTTFLLYRDVNNTTCTNSTLPSYEEIVSHYGESIETKPSKEEEFEGGAIKIRRFEV